MHRKIYEQHYGVKNKRIKSTEAIPEGFTEGRLFTPWNKGKKNV